MKKSLLVFWTALIAGISFSQDKKQTDKPKEAFKKDSVSNVDYKMKVVMTLDTAAYFAIKRIVGSMPASTGAGRLYEVITDTANVKAVRVKKQ